jgi:hypothetical protein
MLLEGDLAAETAQDALAGPVRRLDQNVVQLGAHVLLIHPHVHTTPDGLDAGLQFQIAANPTEVNSRGTSSSQPSRFAAGGDIFEFSFRSDYPLQDNLRALNEFVNGQLNPGPDLRLWMDDESDIEWLKQRLRHDAGAPLELEEHQDTRG